MGTAQFILGRAGTGKTHRLVHAIADLCRADPLGPTIFWLVPKQATFQAERLLTCALGGFARVRVVDAHTLGQTVLDGCGDVGRPAVTAAGRRMILGHLLRTRRRDLAYYGTAAGRPGLAAELDATFAEFDRADIDADALAAAADGLDPDTDDGLRQKLADVRLLMTAYGEYLTANGFDPAQRSAKVLGRVARCPALADATLFVDDFYDFTAAERKLLAAVAGAAARTEISLLLDPDRPAPSDLSPFHRTGRAYRAMQSAFKDAGVTVEPPVALRDVHRPPSLAAVERGLFSPVAKADAAVTFFDATDARAEVDAVARRIRAATAGGDIRYRDIAVIVRQMGDYQQVVDASFGEHGIPYFADHRRPAGHHPLLRLIRSALLIARDRRWPHEAVMAVAKCGLVGLADDAADELENAVLQRRLRGKAAWESDQPWKFEQARLILPEDESTAATPATVDDTRRALLTGLRPLLDVKKATVRDVAAAVFAMLDAFGAPATLAKWIAATDDPERRGEHEQVWAETVGLFEQMVAVIGDQSITVADFLDVLDGGLDEFDLAIAPPTVDQVLVGQADRTRTPAVKLTFVLGLNEGQFPRVEQERLVLSDAERRTLRKRHVDLDDDTTRQLLDERLLAYVAFTRPTEQLVVSRPLTNADGGPGRPSAFWIELQRLCPTADVDHVPRQSATPDPATIGTPRQLVDAVMRWASADDPPAAGDGTMAALYQWLAAHPADGSPVDAMRFRAWRAMSYDNRATLDPALAGRLFPDPLRATVRQLEDATACPFRHFAKYGLKLTERADADVTQLDLHNAYHAVVENLTNELMQRRTDWTQIDPAEAKELIQRHAAEVGRQLRGELMLSSARNLYLLDHIERTLERAVASLAEFSRRGRYRPRYAELRFGSGRGAALPPHVVATPAGRTVRLSGRIDRVDVDEHGQTFTVIDYRLPGGTLSLDKVYYGLSLQLLTYLLVVRDGSEALTGGRKLTPAAALLLGLLRSPNLVKHPGDGKSPDDPDFHLQQKPRGVIDEGAVPLLDADGAGGWSPVVTAYRVKGGGGLGHRKSSDVAAAAEFDGLLELVHQRLGAAADRVMDGDVEVRPYLLGRESPCSRCEYRSVCRFEPGVNRYRVLTPLGREAVLDAVGAAGSSDAGAEGD